MSFLWEAFIRCLGVLVYLLMAMNEGNSWLELSVRVCVWVCVVGGGGLWALNFTSGWIGWAIYWEISNIIITLSSPKIISGFPIPAYGKPKWTFVPTKRCLMATGTNNHKFSDIRHTFPVLTVLESRKSNVSVSGLKLRLRPAWIRSGISRQEVISLTFPTSPGWLHSLTDPLPSSKPPAQQLLSSPIPISVLSDSAALASLVATLDTSA